MTIRNYAFVGSAMLSGVLLNAPSAQCQSPPEITVQASYSAHSDLNFGQYTDSAIGSSPEEITTSAYYYHAPYGLNSYTRIQVVSGNQALHMKAEATQNTYWSEGGNTRVQGDGTFSIVCQGRCFGRAVGQFVLDVGGSGPPHPVRAWNIRFNFGEVSINQSGTIDAGTRHLVFPIDEPFCLFGGTVSGLFSFDLSVTSPGAGHGWCKAYLDLEVTDLLEDIGNRVRFIDPLNDAPTCLGSPGLVGAWEDQLGNIFELKCEGGYFLYYNSRLVGKCPWCWGKNFVQIQALGEKNEEGKYGCFVGSDYRSEEPTDPIVRGWCGEYFGIQGCSDTHDWVQFLFNVGSGELQSFLWQAPYGRGQYGLNPVSTQINNIGTFDPTEVACPQDRADGGKALLFGGDPPTEDVRSRYPFERCDTDFDGDCDQEDFAYISATVGSSYGDANYAFMGDVDSDRSVTVDDLILMYPGDCNQDSVVGLADHSVLYSCFHGVDAALLPIECRCADLDNDLDVDLADFGEFQNRFVGE